MKNNEKQEISREEQRRNRLAGLGLGLALGVVFWSALADLLPAPIDLLVGMATGLVIGHRIGERPLMVMRYPAFVIRRMLLAGAAFVLGLSAYSYLLALDLDRTTHVLSALVAILPTIFLIYAVGSAIASLDEMQRRMQTEAIAIGFAGTASFVAVIALLGLGGVPPPNWYWLILVMAVMWLLGKLWTMWRYR